MSGDEVIPIARGQSNPEDTATRLLLDLVAEEARLRDEASSKFYEAIRSAVRAGVSVSKIAVRAGLTRSRIYQINEEGE